MGLNRVKVDSVAELRKKKTTAQLQQENEALQKKVTTLEDQLTETQLALCDVYEQVIAATSTGEV
jgi:chaperonin cofactor prefoldin